MCSGAGAGWVWAGESSSLGKRTYRASVPGQVETVLVRMGLGVRLEGGVVLDDTVVVREGGEVGHQAWAMRSERGQRMDDLLVERHVFV